jgi:hypothetical protein
MTYAAACLWAAVLLISFLGWGSVVGQLLSPNRQVGWGERAAWGMAALVVIGGALSLVSWASKPVLLVLVGLGAAAWVRDVIRSPSRLFDGPRAIATRARRDPLAGAGMFAVVGVVLVLFLGTASSRGGRGNVTATNFNPHDDFQAYFVFAEKVVQTGSIGVDPFSERRLASSLGGQTVLDAFVLAGIPIQHLHLLDPTLGVVIALAIVVAVASVKGIAPRYVACVALLVVAVAPPTVNTTAVGTALALFFALGAAIDAAPTIDDRDSVRRACLLAFLVAAICALKSSLLAPAVSGLVIAYAWRLTKDSRASSVMRCVALLGIALVLVAALLAPYMLSLRRSSGTFLYPILGRGFRGAFLDPNALLPTRQLLRDFGGMLLHPAFVGLAIVVVADLVSRRQRRENGWSATLPLAIAAAVGIAIVGITLGGAGLHRQTYAFVMPVMALGLMDAFRRIGTGFASPRRAQVSTAVALFGAAVFVLDPEWRTETRYRELPHAIVTGVKGIELVADRDVARLHALQRAVPEGEPILARLEFPFVLDFRRNPIYACDGPGGASPPPGMPTRKGAEPVAAYLRAHGIQYLAYSYGHESGFSRQAFAHRLDPRTNAWYREEAIYTFEFQDNVLELGRRYRHLYDDGDAFVLDLAASVQARP